MSYPVQTPQQLGEVLRGYRRQRGLTQQQLAIRLGVPQKAISAAETHPGRLNVTRLFQLLGALGVGLTLHDRGSGRARAEW